MIYMCGRKKEVIDEREADTFGSGRDNQRVPYMYAQYLTFLRLCTIPLRQSIAGLETSSSVGSNVLIIR